MHCEAWASRGRLPLDQFPGDGMWGNDPFWQQEPGLRAAQATNPAVVPAVAPSLPLCPWLPVPGEGGRTPAPPASLLHPLLFAGAVGAEQSESTGSTHGKPQERAVLPWGLLPAQGQALQSRYHPGPCLSNKLVLCL